MKSKKNPMKTKNKNGKATHAGDIELPPKPTRKRILFQDPTVPVLQVRCRENPKGLLWVRDELSGLIGGMGRYGGSEGSDRSFILESFGGKPFKVDRKMELDDPIFISNLSISILGGTQPDKLAECLLSGADDGFAARFLYCWPERVKFSDVKDAFEGHGKAQAAFAKLAALQPMQDSDGNTSLMHVRFTPKAKRIHSRWIRKFEDATAHHGGMVAGHFAKYRGQAVRIAMVLEFLWWACSDETIEPQKVSSKAVIAAIKLLETYFKPMAIRAFSEAGTPVSQRDATTLAKKIMASKPKHINVREVYRTFKLPGLNRKEAVLAALTELEAAGWVRPKPSRAGEGYGRVRNDYEVNPQLIN